MHVNFTDHADLKGLDHLRFAPGNDLALGDGLGIDLAEPAPGKGRQKQRSYQQCDGATARGRWRFQNLNRGGQELELMGLTADARLFTFSANCRLPDRD